MPGGPDTDRVIRIPGRALGLILLDVAVAALVIPLPACGGDDTVRIEMGEYYMLPSPVKLEKGQQLTVRVVNKGQLSHDLKLEGKNGTQVLPPGYSEIIVIGPFERTISAWCTIEGHRANGMEMQFEVTEPR